MPRPPRSFAITLPLVALLACSETVLQPDSLRDASGASSSGAATHAVGISGIEVASKRVYLAEPAFDAAKRRFIDATTTITAPVPNPLVGLTFIRTAELDLNAVPGSATFLSFDVDRDAVVYVAHDNKLPIPSWLGSAFTDTGLEIRDSGKNRLRLYSRSVPKGRVTLGSNVEKAVKRGSMYTVLVAAQETPADPPPPDLPGPGDPPPPPPANECDAPRAGWIWCDDFEQDRLNGYFEYDSRNGSLTRVAGVGRDGSTGMRTRFAAGQVNAGSLKLAFGLTPASYFRAVDAGTAKYREIYWRMYLRNQPGWVGGGADKLSRATVFAGSNWSQAMIAHVWSGGSASTNSFLYADPASGTDTAGNLRTTKYNDFANLRWLGASRGVQPIFSEPEIGKWHCIEAYVRLNDAGLSNGTLRLWVNGTLDAERTGLNWLGSYDAYGINAVFFENYWNSGSPQPQERYFDNLIVSTERIGC